MLILKGSPNAEYLTVSLLDIIDQIKDPEQYFYCFLWLEATGNPDSYKNTNIIDLEEDINTSESGIVLKYEEAIKLAKSFFQIIEIVVLVDKETANFRRYKFDKEDCMCSFCIELVDSSYWEIQSNDTSLLGPFENILEFKTQWRDLSE